MSGEETTLEPENSVAEDAAAVENYEQRFKDNQAAFTKAQQALKEEQSLWEDEDAVLARLGEKFPHLLVDEDDGSVSDDDDGFVPAEKDPPLHDPRVDEIDPRLRVLEEAEAERRYRADRDSLIGDREIPESGLKFIRAMTAQGGDNKKALESAVNEWFSLFPEDTTQKSKRAPHIPGGGQSTVEAPPDYDSMSLHERHAAMAARAQAMLNQTQ